jgi:acetoin utilization deacetylase AcuC-like enzyme
VSDGVRRPCRLFYSDEYVYDVVEAGWRHTYDVERARRIRDALVASGAAARDDFETPAPISDDDLLLVHTPAYLDAIRDPETLARYLLLDPSHPWDHRLLMPFRYATGGTLGAARTALRDGRIGLNLGGGFHHAQADKAEGFCALADVAVSIRVMRRDGFRGRVLIVDLDYHHGNGNALIFAEDETVFTFSMHNVPWCFIDKRNNRDVELPSHVDDGKYLDLLVGALPGIVESFRPEFAVYLAGSDPYVEDLLGDADLSLRGLFERDRFVSELLAAHDVPYAVVTAGGYGPQSWRVYHHYYHWLLTGTEVAS